MIDKLEEKVHDNDSETLFCKIPGLNNPETHVLTQNRFNTSRGLKFSDLKKTQI